MHFDVHSAFMRIKTNNEDVVSVFCAGSRRHGLVSEGITARRRGELEHIYCFTSDKMNNNNYIFIVI